MISIQTSEQILSEESLSKKRKLDHDDNDDAADGGDPAEAQHNSHDEKSMAKDSQISYNNKPVFYSEWQRCLDIKSGQIYFYNTRTNKRVLSDSSSSMEQHSSAAPMSLDLKLNLPSQSSGGNRGDEKNCRRHEYSEFMTSDSMRDDSGFARSPSWLTLEGEEQEMVTAVCKKCYMLVMMCKSYPSCPNCKFVHSSEVGLTSSIRARPYIV